MLVSWHHLWLHWFADLFVCLCLQALLLLNQLTKGHANIQKIVAFENAFERILDIIVEEGASDGGKNNISLLFPLFPVNTGTSIFIIISMEKNTHHLHNKHINTRLRYRRHALGSCSRTVCVHGLIDHRLIINLSFIYFFPKSVGICIFHWDFSMIFGFGP